MGSLANIFDTGLTIFNSTYSVELDWIGRFIRWLVTSVGSVGLGIILFSLVLKLITLPFDVFQRISMRKQNQKMKANQERMEKLQKQYANDQDAYKQKVMEMYRESGMSIFSSCLPMILSLVIFIIAIGSFNSYSTYANVENYNQMVGAYNETLYEYCVEDVTEDTLFFDETTDINVTEENGKITAKSVTYTVKDNDITNNNYVYYTVKYNVPKGKDGSFAYTYDFAEAKKYIEKADKAYYIYTAKVMMSQIEGAKEMQDEIWANSGIAEKSLSELSKDENTALNAAIKNYFESMGQRAVKTAYDTEIKGNVSFIWIKNIWETDATYKSPVLEYDSFGTAVTERGTCGCSSESKVKGMAAYSQDGYNFVTKNLTAEKDASNGYFILIALSIGTILLQQFVSMRSQKEQQKYSSVDGQGKGQQKMMMIIMTGMFAIFSFLYSSAFAIYLIVSNVFSLLSTIIINKLVDRKLNKQAAAVETKKYQNNALERIEAAKNAGKAAASEKRGEKTPDKKNKK